MFDPISISPIAIFLLGAVAIGCGIAARCYRMNAMIWKAACEVSAKRAYEKGRKDQERLRAAPFDERLVDAYNRGVRDCNLSWTDKIQQLQAEDARKTPLPQGIETKAA